MYGWQNVLLTKCLGVKMLGVKIPACQKVMCTNVGESPVLLPGIRQSVTNTFFLTEYEYRIIFGF